VLKLHKATFLFFRALVLMLLDFFSVLKFRFSEREQSAQLIVRVDNIGDFILWLPSAKKLLSVYPAKRDSILVCNQACVDLAVATDLFSVVVGLDVARLTRDLRYRFQSLRLIARYRASIAIQPSYSRAFLSGDSLVRASGAKVRIGFDGDRNNIRLWEKRISDRWYTKLVRASDLPMMELDRNAEFLRNLGVADVHKCIGVLPKLIELPSEKKIPYDYLVVFPGASSVTRIWPVESFARAAKKVVDEYGFIPIICGGEMERELGNRLLSLIGDERGKNYAGSTSLSELSEIIRGARLVISNETSAAHISAAVSTPSICILGGGHHGRFMPYPQDLEGVKPIAVTNQMSCFGCNWKCRFTDARSAPYPCVESVSVEQVTRAVRVAITQKNSDVENG